MGKQGTGVIVDRWTSRPIDRATGKQGDRWTRRQIEWKSVVLESKMTGGQVEKDMGTQTDRLMGRQGYETGGQVDRGMGNRQTMLWKKGRLVIR